MQRIIVLLSFLAWLEGGAQREPLDFFSKDSMIDRLLPIEILAIGESGHGYATFNEGKSAFLQQLLQLPRFRSVAFESSFALSITSYFRGGNVEKRTAGFLYPFWNTAVVRKTLGQLLEKETNLPMVLGFDIQEDCRYVYLSQLLLERQWITTSRQSLLQSDSILAFYIGPRFSRKSPITSSELQILISNYGKIYEELQLTVIDTMHKKLLLQTIHNRNALCRYLSIGGNSKRMYFRDSSMAANVSWIKEEICQQNALILWSANTHIARSTSGRAPRWMGEWLRQRYANRYLAVGFEKGSGAVPMAEWEPPGINRAYDLVIYYPVLKKIEPEEWITPCNGAN